MAGSREGFRSDIEGLRAVAVLGVVAFHAGVPYLSAGYVGVDIFYVISGYLITQYMLRDLAEKNESWSGFLVEFYARRIRRILPTATLVMVVTLLGAQAIHNVIENAGLAADARSTTLFYSNIHFAHAAADYFAAGKSPSPYLQYWSLSLEEQYYLIWPIGLFALWRWSRSRNHIAAAIGLASVASLVLCVVGTSARPIDAFYMLPARGWQLGCGALLATFEATTARLERRWVAVSGVACIVAAFVVCAGQVPYPGWRAAFPTLGTGLVIAGGTSQGVVQRLLSLRPMQLIGRYSYSIYLWHWPLLVLRPERLKWVYASWLMRTTFVLSASVVAAALTYHLMENPARRARWLRTSARRSLALGAALVVIGLACTFAFGARHHDLSSGQLVASSNGVLGEPVVPTELVPGNMVPSLADSSDREYVHCGHPCVVGSPTARHHIVLFGNSHAGHWGAAFEAASERLDAQVEIDAPGGCASFAFATELMAVHDKDACDHRRRDVYDRIRASHPDLVVLSNMSVDVFEAHPQEWERGVRDAIRELTTSTKVVILSETPKSKTWVPLCLANNITASAHCDVEWPTTINERLRAIATDAGAVYIDLRPLFCAGNRCPAITRDTLIYGDGDHLTVPFSRAQGPWFAAALSDLLH